MLTRPGLQLVRKLPSPKVEKRLRRGLNRLYRKHNFVILHTGRCGSQVLGSLLKQHPEIEYLGEFFYDHRHSPEPFRRLSREMYGRRCRFLSFGAKIQQSAHFDGLGVDLESFLARLRDMNYTRFVVLRRENLLRLVISARRGQELKQWHSTKDADEFKVSIDVNRIFKTVSRLPLVEYFERVERLYQNLFKLLPDDRTLTLSYERHIEQDPRVAYTAVCEFLDARPVPVTIPLKRTNPFPTRDVIENFHDVESVLKDTRYGWMLSDDLPPWGQPA